MADAQKDFIDEYRSYLARFDAKLGPCEFGAYAKLAGRLIKKLRYEEFALKFKEWRDVDRAYGEILERGDTINDVIVKVLRERSDELVMDRKV